MRRSIAAAVALLVVGVLHAADPEVAGPPLRVDSTSTPQRSIAKKRRPGVAIHPAPADAVPSDVPLDLSEPVIRKAIAGSRDPLDDVALPRGATFGAGGAPSQAGIDQGFKRAEIPTCMTPQAFTFDPPQVGPFGLGGLLALPFLVHAIATGKCRH